MRFTSFLINDILLQVSSSVNRKTYTIRFIVYVCLIFYQQLINPTTAKENVSITAMDGGAF